MVLKIEKSGRVHGKSGESSFIQIIGPLFPRNELLSFFLPCSAMRKPTFARGKQQSGHLADQVENVNDDPVGIYVSNPQPKEELPPRGRNPIEITYH